MLWKKENTNGHYIDLIKNVNCSRQRNRINREKNNQFSERVRSEGNQKYSEGDFEGALTKYNESVCLAQDKETLSLAFANRSQCFLKLHLYTRCLIDIQLAKDTGYPIKLMNKLDSRKEECINKMLVTTSTEPVSSFEADEKISQLADFVQIHTDDIYGRHMIAKRDVKIGERIIIEDTYIRTVTGNGNKECTVCGRKKKNFIPCKNCAKAMYCNDKCSQNNFHESECDMAIGTLAEDDWLLYTLRSVVIGVNSFQTINDMMLCVENCRSTNSREIADYSDSPESKYRFFFNLACVVSEQRIFGYLEDAYLIFDTIVNSSKLGKKFETIAAQRFLVHLIIHHHFVLRTNSFGYKEEQSTVHELALYTSYMNHSCLRNTAKLSKGNKSVCKAILPIKQGDQFFVKYLAGEVFGMTTKQRNDELAYSYGFRCRCKLCTIGSLRADFLENDLSFIYVVTNVNKMDNTYDVDLIRNVIQRCLKFLLQNIQIRLDHRKCTTLQIL